MKQESLKEIKRETGHSCVPDLSENGIPDERVEGSSYDQIDFVMEVGFKVIGEIDQLPPDRSIKFDNDIDIAGRVRLSTCIGTKDANGCNAYFSRISGRQFRRTSLISTADVMISIHDEGLPR